MVCEYVRLVNFPTRSFGNVCVVVEGIYTSQTEHFGNTPLCLFLCCYRGYIQMQDWALWKQAFVFMFVLL